MSCSLQDCHSVSHSQDTREFALGKEKPGKKIGRSFIFARADNE
jgi:hypothetical protein